MSVFENDRVEFDYGTKPRSGRVESVSANLLTVEVDDDDSLFKSFYLRQRRDRAKHRVVYNLRVLQS